PAVSADLRRLYNLLYGTTQPSPRRFRCRSARGPPPARRASPELRTAAPASRIRKSHAARPTPRDLPAARHLPPQPPGAECAPPHAASAPPGKTRRPDAGRRRGLPPRDGGADRPRAALRLSPRRWSRSPRPRLAQPTRRRSRSLGARRSLVSVARRGLAKRRD